MEKFTFTIKSVLELVCKCASVCVFSFSRRLSTRSSPARWWTSSHSSTRASRSSRNWSVLTPKSWPSTAADSPRCIIPLLTRICQNKCPLFLETSAKGQMRNINTAETSVLKKTLFRNQLEMFKGPLSEVLLFDVSSNFNWNRKTRRGILSSLSLFF